MENLSKRIIVFDTETTGLKTGVDHIIEIAAIEMIDGKMTGNQFHAFLSPRTKINPRASKVHKMTDDFYKERYDGVYKTDKSVLQNFLVFVGSSDLIGHNVSFDARFLNAELAFFELTPLEPERFICSMKLFYNVVSNYYPELKKANKLSFCCQFFKIKFEESSLHSAIYDTFITAKLLINLLDLHANPSKEFRQSSKTKTYPKTQKLSIDVDELFDGMNESEIAEMIGLEE